MTHFPFINIIWPRNATIYYNALYELANFDLIPTDELEERLNKEIGIDEDEDEDSFDLDEFLSETTISAGYDSSDTI